MQIRECQVNPMMHLCERMKIATGAHECNVGSTGDAIGLVLDGDASGKNGTIATLDCIARNAKEGTVGDDPELLYEGMSKAIRAGKSDSIFIGSKRVYCYARLASVGKTAVTEDWKKRVQLFFDEL